jgi:hypothetical protein
MKKILLLFLIGILAISCAKKKDWECTCNITDMGYSYKDTMVIVGETKAAANKKCGDFGKSHVSNGTYSCKID